MTYIPLQAVTSVDIVTDKTSTILSDHHPDQADVLGHNNSLVCFLQIKEEVGTFLRLRVRWYFICLCLRLGFITVSVTTKPNFSSFTDPKTFSFSVSTTKGQNEYQEKLLYEASPVNLVKHNDGTNQLKYVFA